MTSLLHPLCALVAVAALLYKAGPLRRAPGDPALWALCAVHGFSALSFTLSTPTVWLAVDRLTGIADSAALLAQSSVMCLIAAQCVLLDRLLLPPGRARRNLLRHLLVLCGVLIVLTALFARLDLSGEHPGDFTVHYAGDADYQRYLLLYSVVFMAGEVLVSVLCLRFARRVNRLWLRRGLCVTAVGSALSLGYGAVRLANGVCGCVAQNPSWAERAAWLCGGIGGLLAQTGWTLPGWGPLLTRARRAAHDYRQYQRLHPLWLAMVRSRPDITLEEGRYSRLSSLLTVRNIEFRLYRRAIEIRDGQLALRESLDAEVAERAARLGRATGLVGEELAAGVTAAQLKAALHTRRLGLRPAVPDMLKAADGPSAADLSAEITWLVRVARAYRACPLLTPG
ncbi:MAB_1171c family putative transporter [Streptomyces sp. NPDC006197]|uniref:MAB_1171c family putative transporter n=1 Tax=Streptomyces sp. NPDC006197 TaxID=3156685 RepID=UPI0033B7AF74